MEWEEGRLYGLKIRKIYIQILKYFCGVIEYLHTIAIPKLWKLRLFCLHVKYSN
jgi:hypothetical protein